MKRSIFFLIAVAVTYIMPSAVLSQTFNGEPNPVGANIAQNSMIGTWKSSSANCEIEFYSDDGTNVEGSCSRGGFGGFDHIINGEYLRSGKAIYITNERIDPKGCSTKVEGRINIVNNQTVKYYQNGWDGCGVKTGPVTEYWKRVNSTNH